MQAEGLLLSGHLFGWILKASHIGLRFASCFSVVRPGSHLVPAGQLMLSVARHRTLCSITSEYRVGVASLGQDLWSESGLIA